MSGEDKYDTPASERHRHLEKLKTSDLVKRGAFFNAVIAEVERAYRKHGDDPWGRHEFYAIAKEEFEEMWDTIKRDRPDPELLKELVSVAAMCLRYWETGDRYRGEFQHE
jgi:hypothetical protein